MHIYLLLPGSPCINVLHNVRLYCGNQGKYFFSSLDDYIFGKTFLTCRGKKIVGSTKPEKLSNSPATVAHSTDFHMSYLNYLNLNFSYLSLYWQFLPQMLSLHRNIIPAGLKTCPIIISRNFMMSYEIYMWHIEVCTFSYIDVSGGALSSPTVMRQTYIAQRLLTTLGKIVYSHSFTGNYSAMYVLIHEADPQSCSLVITKCLLSVRPFVCPYVCTHFSKSSETRKSSLPAGLWAGHVDHWWLSYLVWLSCLLRCLYTCYCSK